MVLIDFTFMKFFDFRIYLPYHAINIGFITGDYKINELISDPFIVVKINKTVLKFGQFLTEVVNGKCSEAPCGRQGAIYFLQPLKLLDVSSYPALQNLLQSNSGHRHA